MSESKKYLVVGSNVNLRNLVAAWFRKHGDVFMSQQSIPDFIAWAEKDPNVVFTGYDIVLVVVAEGEGANLSELAVFSGFTKIVRIPEDEVSHAILNSDFLCEYVKRVLEHRDFKFIEGD